MKIVFFSNVTENTKRFVDKLGFESVRIPIFFDKEPLYVTDPYILICPTYGSGRNHKTVPKQVIKFLNIESNRELIRGVLPTGNKNFGLDYCASGDIIKQKTGVPIIDRVELLGTPEDVERVKEKLKDMGVEIE